MEIGSFAFHSSEGLSYNNGGEFSWFEDMENGFNGNGKKRGRKDSEESLVNEELEKNGSRDVLSSILLLDDGAKQEQHQWLTDPNPERASFEANYKNEVQEMNDYFDQIQSHHAEMNELDDSRNKRACKSSSPAASTATAAVVSAGNSDNEGPSHSGGGSGHHKRLWVKDRSKDWWDKFNHPDFSDEEFKRAFRMSKATFNMICEELEPAVMKKNTMLRDAIPVRQRVAVCIWRLATGEPLRMVSNRFGLGISTCHKLVLEVCNAIRTVLMPKFVQWPDDNKMKKIKDEYESATGIPNIGGAIYTTHLPIIAPKANAAAYFNKKHTERSQKNSYSITLQGIVDKNGVFSDVCIGWPGSMSDEQILEKSAFYQSATEGHVKDTWVVGSKAYPLMDWILVPYSHQNVTWAQHALNEKIGEIEKVGKEAFGRLKGRWSCLQKRSEVKLQELLVVLGACCVLHNICEIRNEEMEGGLNFEVFDDEVIPENNLRSTSAVQARDHIAHNLLHHGLAGTAFL
ncbi:hypothetical protein F3Y22_tig00110597pilonHSYRG00122 [Hibiscus syriacus]|uniref:DDE Tnp4 domain-containing protein n=1 Tax=Hibiscus syriacus TaxID=106335 RepID=A0A6A3A283_HIBSY|nr:protein ALP1-like [Hibiscus syriacus]KAE8698404.1 hypothetical protein F3Y22_tig00110597pilonHSYRG00122 [Hibiscus syriacus]